MSIILDRVRCGSLGTYISHSRRIPGWTRGAEAVALAQLSYSLPDNAIVVENGCFLGCSTVVLAGARKLRGSGIVHCVDPFDGSGDSFSIPIYHSISDSLGAPLRECFEENISWAGLSDWVEVHQGLGHEVAATWTEPIDLLFLDGDQSYEAVQTAYRSWSPFIKPGGMIAVHNSAPGDYEEGHDGSMRLAAEVIRPPQYEEVRCTGITTFARKAQRKEAHTAG